MITVHLERPGRINDNIRRQGCELRFQIAVAIKALRHQRRLRGKRSTERRCLFPRTAGNNERKRLFIGKELRQTPAESAIAAEDQNLQRRFHARKRSW
jgi:hypothetical protein